MEPTVNPGATSVTVVQYNQTVVGPIPQQAEVVPGPQPVIIQCPLCYANVVTVIKHEHTWKTHCLASVICLLGGIICCLIPYYLKAYNYVEHYCPNCKGLIFVYKK